MYFKNILAFNFLIKSFSKSLLLRMKIKLVLKETLPNLVFIVSTSLLYYYFYLFITTIFFFFDPERINVMGWKKKQTNQPTEFPHRQHATECLSGALHL